MRRRRAVDLVQVFRDRPVPFGIATGLLKRSLRLTSARRSLLLAGSYEAAASDAALLRKLRDHRSGRAGGFPPDARIADRVNHGGHMR